MRSRVLAQAHLSVCPRIRRLIDGNSAAALQMVDRDWNNQVVPSLTAGFWAADHRAVTRAI
jgi:hypothetical protein